jgi:hypothetical protein
MKGSQKPKKLQKKVAQRTLKERRAEKRAAGERELFPRLSSIPGNNGSKPPRGHS